MSGQGCTALGCRCWSSYPRTEPSSRWWSTPWWYVGATGKREIDNSPWHRAGPLKERGAKPYTLHQACTPTPHNRHARRWAIHAGLPTLARNRPRDVSACRKRHPSLCATHRRASALQVQCVCLDLCVDRFERQTSSVVRPRDVSARRAVRPNHTP